MPEYKHTLAKVKVPSFRWVPEERQECKDNVEQCVDVTKPYCREVIHLVEMTMLLISYLGDDGDAPFPGVGPCLQREVDLPDREEVCNKRC